VDCTPDGHGDCIRIVNGQQMFVEPSGKQLTLQELRQGLRKQQQAHQEQDRERENAQACERDANGLRVFSDGDGDDDGDDDDSCEVLYYSRQVRPDT